MSAYVCTVGPAQYDVVNYARQMTRDTDAANYVVPDVAYQAMVSVVGRDLSRFIPMSALVGNIFAQTSPLITVTGQHRYLATVGNGFNGSVFQVTDVLYRASGGFSAATEIGYMALLPFSPANAFLFTPSLLDSPSARIERDEYLNELDAYGKGYAGIGIDPSGNYFIDLYPIPQTSGLPIYVRYETLHADTGVGGNSNYATVPPVNDRHFAELLRALALENFAHEFAQQLRVKAGQDVVDVDAAHFRTQGDQVRQQVYQELGVTAGVIERSPQ